MKGKDTELAILTLYRQEEKSVHAVAKELGVHRSVVTRVLKKYDMEREQASGTAWPKRRRLTDAYDALILSTLEDTPTISAVRLFRMAQERGYRGGESQFRKRVAELRGNKRPEAYLQLLSLPGEVLQVDWADFGVVEVKGGTRRLYAAVFVLSYSRAIHATFSFDCKTSTLLHAQQQAFEWFQGVPTTCLYDNMKSVVIARPSSTTAVYNEEILHYAKHFNFKVKVTGVRKPHHKGRVERAIRYLRGSFFTGTKWQQLPELNKLARGWCETVALQRGWAEDATYSVAEKLEEERQRLRPLPNTTYACVETVQGKSAKKTHYLSFDSNQYSIPASGMGHTLSIVASQEHVRIIHGTKLMALHSRSFDKGQRISDPSHIKEIVDTKQGAGKDALMQLLVSQVSEAQAFFNRLKEFGQLNARTLATLVEALELYGAYEFREALIIITKSEQRRNLVQQLTTELENARITKGLPPLLPIPYKNTK